MCLSLERMNTGGERLFSRKDLQDLQAATMREEHEKNVKRIVQEIRTAVLTKAMKSKDQGYFYAVPPVPLHIPPSNSIVLNIYTYSDIVSCFQWAANPEEERRRLIDDIIAGLQAGFPDVTIVYKSQKRVASDSDGNQVIYPDVNQGIYLDWS